MRQKSYSEMRGVSLDLLNRAVAAHGHPPDNFVDSPEGGLAALPSVGGRTQGRRFGASMNAELRRLIAAANGGQIYVGSDLGDDIVASGP